MVRVIRIMPNVLAPAADGKATSVMHLGSGATNEDAELITKLFESIGKVWRVDEKVFDAFTVLSGSGPASIYLMIEGLADGGVAAGLHRELAHDLASQTVLRGASMAANARNHAGHLKDIAFADGSTIAAIQELEKAGLRGALMSAVLAAGKRSQELSHS